jgi:hypothetical protein
MPKKSNKHRVPVTVVRFSFEEENEANFDITLKIIEEIMYMESMKYESDVFDDWVNQELEKQTTSHPE